jgi:hypothetical protein
VTGTNAYVRRVEAGNAKNIGMVKLAIPILIGGIPFTSDRQRRYLIWRKLDTESGSNWTPDPVLAGHPIRN